MFLIHSIFHSRNLNNITLLLFNVCFEVICRYNKHLRQGELTPCIVSCLDIPTLRLFFFFFLRPSVLPVEHHREYHEHHSEMTEPVIIIISLWHGLKKCYYCLSNRVYLEVLSASLLHNAALFQLLICVHFPRLLSLPKQEQFKSMTELWGNQKFYQLLLTNRGRFGKAEFCTTNVNWARAREILSATDRDTVRTRTISAKISQCVIISDINGFPISDQHSRIPLSLFKLHSLPPSPPSQFCEVFSCSYLFKAFEFHFIL